MVVRCSELGNVILVMVVNVMFEFGTCGRHIHLHIRSMHASYQRKLFVSNGSPKRGDRKAASVKQGCAKAR